MNLYSEKKLFSRMIMVQLLYRYEIDSFSDTSITSLIQEIAGIVQELLLEFDYNQELPFQANDKFIIDNFLCIVKYSDELDQRIIGFLQKTWTIAELDLVIKNVLRAAVFEIFYLKTPPKVAIDQYVGIAGLFFDQEEIGFINGILDKMAFTDKASSDEPATENSTE